MRTESESRESYNTADEAFNRDDNGTSLFTISTGEVSDGELGVGKNTKGKYNVGDDMKMFD